VIKKKHIEGEVNEEEKKKKKKMLNLKDLKGVYTYV